MPTVTATSRVLSAWGVAFARRLAAIRPRWGCLGRDTFSAEAFPGNGPNYSTTKIPNVGWVG